MVDLAGAAERILLGESLSSIASEFRMDLIVEMSLDPSDAPDDLFRKETTRFMNQLCRYLGDNHDHDTRVASALRDWVRRVEEYEAFDTLLSCYRFDGREAVLRRGRVLFPGPLTAHWDEAGRA
jgi:hypothetical protein